MTAMRSCHERRRSELLQGTLKSIIAGGRIPNYAKYADQLGPRAYIDKVKLKELFDPTLSFQLSNDFHVLKVTKG